MGSLTLSKEWIVGGMEDVGEREGGGEKVGNGFGMKNEKRKLLKIFKKEAKEILT